MKYKKSDLFYVYVYLNVLCKGIGLSNDSSAYFFLIILGGIALVLKMFEDKYTRKEFIIISILIAIGLMSVLLTRKPTLMITCLCIAGMKNINIDSLFKGMYKLRLATFIIVVLSSLFGIIPNESVEMWRNGAFETRYSLGFGHPNTLQLSLFILLALHIYVKYDKLKFIDYVLMFASNLFIYHYSISRTGFIAINLLIILCFISKLNINIIKKTIINSPKYVYIALLIFSFVSGMLYGKYEIFNKLNSILTGRLAYSNYYLSNYGFTLFGNNLATDTNAIFDNGYIYMYIQFGILGFILLTWFFFKIFNNVKNKKDIRKSILILLFLIYIFTESITPNIFMNIILFFSAPTIFKNMKEEQS